MKSIKRLLLTTIFLCSYSVTALDELNIGYFLEWPKASQVAQLEKTFDQRMGLKVNWYPFDNGNDMTNAMIAGDIDIASDQGLVPFVVAVTKGVPLKLIGVAMSYAESDNCIARTELGITKENASKKLLGKKIGTPVGNVTYFKLLKMLEHFDVSKNDVTILSMNNSDVSSALARGDVDIGCVFGSSLNRMKQHGSVIMTGAEQEAIGLKVFDIVSVTEKFAKKHPKVVTQFMQITEDANLAYNRYPERFYNILSKASGSNVKDTVSTLDTFTFLTRSEQLSDDWMLGGIQKLMKDIADFFEKEKILRRSRSQEYYSDKVDVNFLSKVK